MKLLTAHVTNFRSVLDSNPVTIGGSTCLVGKNEAGKTAFLKALEGLRLVDAEYEQYGKTENYPRRFLADYEERHDGDDAVVIQTTWSLETADRKVLADEFGEDAVNGDNVTIEKSYDSKTTSWTVPIDQSVVLKRLAARFDLTDDEAAPFSDAGTTFDAAKRLGAVAEPTESQTEMLAAINKYRDQSASKRAIDLLNPLTPKFLYFSHYDRMAGEISINQLAKDKA